MKKHLPLIIIILVFLIGLGVLLYPVISEFVNARNQTRAVSDYAASVAQLDTQDYRDLLHQARQFNENLAANRNIYATPAEAALAYETMLQVGSSDVMGYIEIPKIDVRLPLYHGTGHAVLQIGVGHLEGTSLPIGGQDTHAVLSGHRGLPSAKLFTNLDQLELDDTFSIHVLDQLLTYQVDQIEVVEPDQVEKLGIISGEDYVTLVTCTPYGVNTHRLLIRGSRIANPPQSTDHIVPTVIINQTDPFIIASIIAALTLTIIITALLLVRRARRRRKTVDSEIKSLANSPAPDLDHPEGPAVIPEKGAE